MVINNDNTNNGRHENNRFRPVVRAVNRYRFFGIDTFETESILGFETFKTFDTFDTDKEKTIFDLFSTTTRTNYFFCCCSVSVLIKCERRNDMASNVSSFILQRNLVTMLPLAHIGKLSGLPPWKWTFGK
jgi:hypothetical protein